jgi:hypothetical protein
MGPRSENKKKRIEGREWYSPEGTEGETDFLIQPTGGGSDDGGDETSAGEGSRIIGVGSNQANDQRGRHPPAHPSTRRAERLLLIGGGSTNLPFGERGLISFFFFFFSFPLRGEEEGEGEGEDGEASRQASERACGG